MLLPDFRQSMRAPMTGRHSRHSTPGTHVADQHVARRRCHDPPEPHSRSDRFQHDQFAPPRHERLPMIAPTNILVPTDFGDAADTALRYARAFAHAFGSTLHVLHVRESRERGVRLR